MSATDSAAPAPKVTTAGAWLACWVAGWAAAVVVFHVALAAAVAWTPSLANRLAERTEHETGTAELPSGVAGVVDLWFEAAAALRPVSRVMGFSGVAVGYALFLAACALLRGSERGRRATRVLLAAAALHAVVTIGWLVVLRATQLADWNARHVAALDDVARANPGALAPPPVLAASAPIVAVIVLVGALVATAVSLALFRLAGRPHARAWCAARAGKPPIAPAGPPR